MSHSQGAVGRSESRKWTHPMRRKQVIRQLFTKTKLRQKKKNMTGSLARSVIVKTLH